MVNSTPSCLREKFMSVSIFSVRLTLFPGGMTIFKSSKSTKKVISKALSFSKKTDPFFYIFCLISLHSFAQ